MKNHPAACCFHEVFSGLARFFIAFLRFASERQDKSRKSHGKQVSVVRWIRINQWEITENIIKYMTKHDKTWQNMTKLSKSRFLDLPLLLPFLVTGAFPFCGIFHQLLLSHLQPLVIRVDVPSFFAHLQETRASLGTKRNRIWMLHRAWPNQSCVRCCVSVCHVKNENCYGAGSMASLSCELQFLSGHPLTASPHHPNSQAPDIPDQSL